MSTTEKQKNYKETRQLQDANLQQSWYKQAYLLNYMYPLVKPLTKKINPSKYVKLIDTKNSSEMVLNRLTISKEVMTFFEGRPIDYAQLVPQIEIYKIYTKDKKRVTEVLLPFTSFTNFQKDWTSANLLNAPFRGREAGIESVSVKMDGIGKNPYQANFVSVTLNLVFNDVKTLFKTWGTKDGHEVQYADLIRYPASTKGSDTKAESLPAFSQIKLSIGWGANEQNPIFKETTKGALFASAAKNSRMNFVLTFHKHDMEFMENGSVKVTVQYQGALENAFKTINSDILNSYNIDDKNIRTLKAQLIKLEATGEWDATKKAFGANKKQLSDLKKQKAALEKLEATRKKIEDLVKAAKGDDATYVDLQKQLSKDYEAFKETLKGYQSTQDFLKSELEAAAKGIPIDKNLLSAASGAGMDTKKVGAEIGKQIATAENSVKYAVELKKKRNQVLKGIQALEANMRAQNLFAHVEQLMKKDRVAWINIHKNKAFESFTGYRELLEGLDKFKRKAMQETGLSAKELSALEDSGVDVKGLVNMTEKERTEAMSTLQQDSAKSAPPAAGAQTGGLDPKQAAKNLKEKLKAEKLIETLTTPSGEEITINTFKKIGGASELFSSEDTSKGEKIMFFMLGDLISTIFDYGKFGEGLEEQIPGYRLIFGNMEFNAPMANNATIASLYHLPISLEFFTIFLAQKIVAEGKKSYALKVFIQDLMQFIVDKITAPSGIAAEGLAMVNPTSSKKFALELTPLGLPKKFLESKMKSGVHLNPVLDLGIENEKKYNVAKKIPINKLSSAFLLAPRVDDPFQERALGLQVADPIQDKLEGIPHFMVGGPSTGLLKSIKFTEVASPEFAMSMMRTGAGSGVLPGRGNIQPKYFKCEMVLIGNPYFTIGQKFYVNTALISGGLFEKHNIMNGGYYNVMSVETNISSGKWETRIGATLLYTDSAITASKKKAKAAAQKVKDEPEAKQAELKQKQIDAEHEAGNAVKNIPPSNP